MSNTHRVVWFDQQIRAAKYPNASMLATHFEISQRQAARDIEYLRYSLGAPLQYCYQHKGYLYDEGSFFLPAIYVTEEQSEALKRLSLTYNLIPEQHARNMAALFMRLAQSHGEQEADTAMTPITEQAIVVEFSHPGMIDFGGLQAMLLNTNLYRLTASDYRSILLFLLTCPCDFRVISPNWLKLHLRKLVEKGLNNLVH